MSVSQEKQQRQQVNFLLAEVALVEQGCKDVRIEKPIFHLDDFQHNKAELGQLLHSTKDKIQIRADIKTRIDKSTEEIRLKYEIESDIARAKELHTLMTESYNNDLKKFQEKKSNALNEAELEERQKILRLFQQDLEYTENTFKPKSTSIGLRLARDRREERKRLREQGIMSPEAIPLSAAQQEFIQESIQRDARLDDKLDQIGYEVRKLHEIAFEVNQELENQQTALESVDEKISALQSKLETRNRQIKKLLEETGGATRWCVALVLFVILLALCGYIYNSV